MAGAQCLLLWVVHHRRRLGPGLYSYLECYLLLRREEGRVLTYRERADHVSRQREGASCEGARASSLVYSSWVSIVSSWAGGAGGRCSRSCVGGLGGSGWVRLPCPRGRPPPQHDLPVSAVCPHGPARVSRLPGAVERWSIVPVVPWVRVRSCRLHAPGTSARRLGRVVFGGCWWWNWPAQSSSGVSYLQLFWRIPEMRVQGLAHSRRSQVYAHQIEFKSI